MKTLLVMLSMGMFFVVSSNALSKVFANTLLDGDSNFALFVIGLGFGVWASRDLGFID